MMEPDPSNKKTEQENGLSALRTYEDDVANLVQTKQISTAKMAIAEEEKRRQSAPQEEPETKKGAPVKIIISVILILLGGGAVFLAFQYGMVPEQITNFVKKDPINQQILTRESSVFISADEKTNQTIKNEIIDNINKIESNSGSIIGFEILKTETITAEDGTSTEIERNITTEEFFEIIGSTADDRMLRSMDDIFLFGVDKGVENTPFLILKTSDINLSFSEVYKWESKMYQDLKDVLLLKDEVPEFIEIDVPIATSTATSTTIDFATSTTEESQIDNQEGEGTETEISTSTSTTTPQTTKQRVENPDPSFNPTIFEDLVLSNRDVRAIIDEAGQTILMYSFVDDENIVFTKDVNTFQKLIQRLNSRMLVR